MNPTIFNQSDLIDLGEKLKTIGSRILFISSNLQEERETIELLKKIFIDNTLTFIEYNQPENINNNTLNKTIERAKNFDVQVILALGQINQRISGRYISQELKLPYFEILTSFDNPFLLNSFIPITNRVNDNYELLQISPSRIDGIVLMDNIITKKEKVDNVLNIVSLLFEITQILSLEKIDPYILHEGKHLIFRILDLVENENLSAKELFHLGLTTSRFMSLLERYIPELTIISWILSNRFKINRKIIQAKIIPWILDSVYPDISNQIRDVLSRYGIDGRLSELGISLNQLFSITNISDSSSSILNNAF